MRWYWLVLLLIAGAVVVTLQRRRTERRAREFAAWAKRRGLVYHPGPDRSLARQFLEFGALSRGDHHVATNICRGIVDGRETLAFDLAWRASDQGDPGNLTAVLVKTDFPLIPLRVRREFTLDRLAEAVGLNDIEFESAAFNDRFHVTSADRKFAREVIHPRMMEYLLAHATLPIELAGWHALVWNPGRLAPAALDGALQLAQGVLARIPEHVRRDLLGETPRAPRGKA